MKTNGNELNTEESPAQKWSLFESIQRKRFVSTGVAATGWPPRATATSSGLGHNREISGTQADGEIASGTTGYRPAAVVSFLLISGCITIKFFKFMFFAAPPVVQGSSAAA